MQPVNHYACMSLTTVLSQYFCHYIDRLLLGLVFWATISAPCAWLSCSLLYCIIVTLFYNLSKLNMIWYDMIWIAVLQVKMHIVMDESKAVSRGILLQSASIFTHKKCPFQWWDLHSRLNTCHRFWADTSLLANGISVASAVFAQLTHVLNTQTKMQ